MPKIEFQKIFLCGLFLAFLLSLPPSKVYADNQNGSASVTATIAAQASDFQFLFRQLSTQSTFSGKDTIQYEITYGNSTAASLPITIVAQWNQGVIQDGTNLPIDILEYNIGSATKGYGGISPIIDTINKTITWTIPAVPRNTADQVVDFSLKTTGNYTGQSTIQFSASAYLTSTTVTLPTSIITATYYNAISPTTIIAPSIRPTITPSPIAIPTPLISPPLQITSVSITKISDSEVSIETKSNQATSFQLQYGTSPDLLDKSVQFATLTTQQDFGIAGLNANTVYYFRIIAIDSSGKRITSDIFTVNTAHVSAIPQLNLQSLVVTSQDVIVSNSSLNNNTIQRILLPINSNFSLRFSFAAQTRITSVDAYTRNALILGFSNGSVEATDSYTKFVEISRNEYLGRLRTLNQPGTYEVFIRVRDDAGNISQQPLMILYNSAPFLVTDSHHKPIENARVFLSLYNPLTEKYEGASSQALVFKNPIYSNLEGIIPVVLPQGMYKAEASELGYKPTIKFFTIGQNPGQTYPRIVLADAPFSFITMWMYNTTTFVEVLQNAQQFVQQLSHSYRFFDLILLTYLMCLVILSLIAFKSRTNISYLHIPRYIRFRLSRIAKSTGYIEGRVVDDAGHALANTMIYLLDHNLSVINQIKSTKTGNFYFRRPTLAGLSLQAFDPSYRTATYTINSTDPIQITLSRTHTLTYSIKARALSVVEGLLSFGFEILLVISILFEVLFASTFGIMNALPFIVISSLNVLVWLLYIHHSFVRPSRE